MNALIVGGGKVGANLATRLTAEKHDVTVVEFDAARCGRLEEFTEGVRIVCGDGDEPYVLEDAGIRNAHAVIAATGDDEDNLVVCLLSKLEYNVPLTIARINNPVNEWLFTQRFGVDQPVSNTSIMVDLLDRCIASDGTAVCTIEP